MIGVVFSSFDHINCLCHLIQKKYQSPNCRHSMIRIQISKDYFILIWNRMSTWRSIFLLSAHWVFFVGWWKIDILIEVFSSVFDEVFLFSDWDKRNAIDISCRIPPREGNAEKHILVTFIILIHEFILSVSILSLLVE